MGSAASAKDDAAVMVASPALKHHDPESTRLRGAKQDFYDQTMRIFSKNDVNSRHPGQAPDVSHFADVQVDHMLRKEIELNDRGFYRDLSRAELQQQACMENRKVRMASMSPPDSPKSRSRRGSRGSLGSAAGSAAGSSPWSPKSVGSASPWGKSGDPVMSPTVSRAASLKGRRESRSRRNSHDGV
ncbi:unnamed protein product [Durusdinium trenchii]|uniref:Uncharacterized protein n=1 Tax=Durusdinium trenchii TaxID=1381693 RepID=A0ABP0PJ04_9DINO